MMKTLLIIMIAMGMGAILIIHLQELDSQSDSENNKWQQMAELQGENFTLKIERSSLKRKVVSLEKRIEVNNNITYSYMTRVLIDSFEDIRKNLLRCIGRLDNPEKEAVFFQRLVEKIKKLEKAYEEFFGKVTKDLSRWDKELIQALREMDKYNIPTTQPALVSEEITE